MRSGRARGPVADAAGTVVVFAADETASVPLNQILWSGALAAVFLGVAVWIDMPAGTATGTLKCYDSLGHYQPCVTQADAAALRAARRTNEADQPARWSAAAPHAPESWAASAPY